MFVVLAHVILLALKTARKIDMPSGDDATKMVRLAGIGKRKDSLEPRTDEEEIDIGPVHQTVAGGKKIEEDECNIWM
jgi:hypothetical protein